MHHESENLTSDIPFGTYFSAYGPSPPDPPRLANPNAQHLRTEITMKQAYRRTVSAAQIAE